MRRWWTAAMLALCVAVSTGAQDSGTGPEQALLSAVGALTGANAYATYMALGSAADSFAGEVYGSEKVLTVVRTLRTLALGAARGLDTLIGARFLHPQDRVYVQDMVEAYGLLVAQADGFETWVKTGARGEFDRARDLAWAAISRTLDADTEPAPAPPPPDGGAGPEEGLE